MWFINANYPLDTDNISFNSSAVSPKIILSGFFYKTRIAGYFDLLVIIVKNNSIKSLESGRICGEKKIVEFTCQEDGAVSIEGYNVDSHIIVR